MGTHPIFESDFDCLTECMFRAFSRGLSITRVRVSTNPFHGNDDAIRTDDTSLQRRIVKHATFKERAENPDQESYLYRERRGTVLKSRKHWNVYKKWTEAEHDKLHREVPAIHTQHQFHVYTGTKSRKHLDTHYMYDKTLLSKLAQSFANEIRDKHVIEMYPAFGLLSQRLMKREPLSYTFIEPDKRVVKSLQRVAQAAEDNAIGVRLIRTEPMEDLFGRFHYDSVIRNREPSPDWLLTEETETVVVSNAPFWCTYLTLQKLCIDCSLGDGFFKAGRVPIFIATQDAVGSRILSRMSSMAKLIDNYFEVAPCAAIEGHHYRPKASVSVLWLKLTPRPVPLINMPIQDVQLLLAIMFDSDNGNDVFSVRRSDKLGPWLVDRLTYLIDVEKAARVGLENLVATLLRLAELPPDKDLKFLSTGELARITQLLSQFEASGFDEIEPRVMNPNELIESSDNIEAIFEGVSEYNRQLRESTADHSRKRAAQEYADRVVAEYNLSPDKDEVRRGMTSHTIGDDRGGKGEVEWQARGDIKRAYKEQVARHVQGKGVYRSKRQGWNKRGPISRRH